MSARGHKDAFDQFASMGMDWIVRACNPKLENRDRFRTSGVQWVDGLSRTFTVVRIYENQGTADLELTTRAQKIEMHIPLAAIHPDRRGALVKACSSC